jgi:hypothetical protein
MSRSLLFTLSGIAGALNQTADFGRTISFAVADATTLQLPSSEPLRISCLRVSSVQLAAFAAEPARHLRSDVDRETNQPPLKIPLPIKVFRIALQKALPRLRHSPCMQSLSIVFISRLRREPNPSLVTLKDDWGGPGLNQKGKQHKKLLRPPGESVSVALIPWGRGSSCPRRCLNEQAAIGRLVPCGTYFCGSLHTCVWVSNVFRRPVRCNLIDTAGLRNRRDASLQCSDAVIDHRLPDRTVQPRSGLRSQASEPSSNKCDVAIS